ncbi:RluA family pseudouridine synthase [Geoalkalibacter sp.]|uniref:RluA family pseudouridine synthase n=1 Tax=Geoalkalibacter sp. TaxID=3041440 RepID=UPI00272EAC7C|nr:RluA family pseudouridine synthase [Geoalkalibacter sp.]
MHASNRAGKKFQPGGMSILHEDREIILVVKPAGLLTVGTERDKTRTAHYLLNDYVRKGDPRSRNRVYVVHRLDQETSGILLFAKSEAAKKFLQQNWESTEKHYLAIVHGHLAAKAGTISSFLVENAAHRVYSTKEPDLGKLSHTAYQVLRESQKFSLLDIHLLTGRKHQIRVHFAEQGHPLLGDVKYGNTATPSQRLALHASSIAFTHPAHGARMTFTSDMSLELVRLLGKL